MFAASLLLLLPGCQGPLGPQGTDPETGTVRLTLEMPPVGRAILPTITLADFPHFRLAFTPAAGGTTIYGEWDRNAAGDIDGEVTLPEGTWNLVVTAYLTEAGFNAGNPVLRNFASIPITVGAGTFTNVGEVELFPVPAADGAQGTFSWDITFPGTATEATLTVTELGNVHNVVQTVNLSVDGNAESSMPLDVGSYNVLVRVVDGNNIATLGMALHILPFFQMPSHLRHVFESTHFRTPFTGYLEDLITFDGDGWDDDYPDWTGQITEGAFAAVGPLGVTQGGTVTTSWVDHQDSLVIRQANRAANHYGITLDTEGLIPRDRLTITGRAHVREATSAEIGWGRRMEINTNLGGGDGDVAAYGLGATTTTGYVNFTLGWTYAEDAHANFDGIIRIQSNGGGTFADVGILAFYITGIAIYRPTPIDDPVDGVLGDFITLTGLLAGSTFDWLDDPIRQGAFGPVGPLVSTGGPAAWVVRNYDYLSLRHDGPADWSGIDILTSVLPLQVDDVITVYIRGLPVGVTLNGDRNGWQNLAQVDLTGVDTPVRLRGTVNAATAAASGPRIQIGEAAGVFYVDSIEIYRPDPAARFGNLPSAPATVDLTGIDPERIRFNTATTDTTNIASGGIVTTDTTDGNFIVAADRFSGNQGTIFTIEVPAGAAVGDVIHVAGRKGSVGGDGYIQIAGVDIGRGSGTIAGQFQTIETWVRAITLTQGMIDNGIPITINAWGGGTPGADGNPTRLNDIGFQIAIDQVVVVETVDPYITQRGALQSAIAAAQRLVQQAYTDVTWTPFASALAAAVAGVTDEATGAGGRMDGLRTALTGAQAALVIDACEYWQEVLDRFMGTAAADIGAAGTAVLAVRAGIVVYNIQQQWEGPTVSIAAMRGLNSGDIVITGTIDGYFPVWGPRFEIGPIQGNATSITVASDAAFGNSRLVSNPLADSFIITGITIGGVSIFDLLHPDVPSGDAGLNITFPQLTNPLGPVIEHTVTLASVVGSTISAPAGFTGHTWSHNLAVIHSGATLTLDASFARAGRHLVTLRANYGGRTYSQIVAITVTAP